MKPAKRKDEWFDDEDIWRETYPFLFPEARFVSAVELVDKALVLTQPQGLTALDLACGPGRCSIALAKRGFTVTGVDRTAFFLEKAKERAESDRIKVEWIQKDMRDFIRHDAYDVALSIFTSFGYFEDPNEDMTVLGNVFASLKPGGAFLIDMNGKEVLARKYLPSSVDTFPDGSMLIERRRIQDGWAKIHTDWILIRNGKTRMFTFRLNLYSAQELREKMERVGFVDVKMYGGLDAEPYNVDAKRLIAVGRKPGKA
jgi:SAM-dependent methyltransferase